VSSKSALIESHFLPNLHYLSKFAAFDTIYIEAKEHYKKRSFRNRTTISSPNGALNLSVPLLKGKNNALPMDQVQIAYHDRWESKLCRAIQSSYGKTAFFLHYYDELEAILLSKPSSLLDLNSQLTQYLIDAFQIDCELKFSSSYQKTEETDPQLTDLRDLIHPKSEYKDPNFQEQSYPQVFEAKTGFLHNISALELLFTQGPQGIFHLEACSAK
jgi:hypothetical protein